MAKNQEAEKQLQNIRNAKNPEVEKVAKKLTTATIICGIGFVLAFAMKTAGILGGWVMVVPFVALLIYFIFTVVKMAKLLSKQGLLDTNAIKQEEQRQLQKKMANKSQKAKTGYNSKKKKKKKK